MEVPSGLYRLAKRLSLGRLMRYFALWARYLLRRSQSALFGTPCRRRKRSIGRSPDKPGLYAIRFYAALDSGAHLEARGLLAVVADEERQ
jgi:hypothetical protein